MSQKHHQIIHNKPHLRTTSPTLTSTSPAAVMTSTTNTTTTALPAPPFSTTTTSGVKSFRGSHRRRSIDSHSHSHRRHSHSSRGTINDINSNGSSSIDIMDFGVPQQRRRSSGLLSNLIHYGEAMQRLVDGSGCSGGGASSSSSTDQTELSQVWKDNDGFLGWDHGVTNKEKRRLSRERKLWGAPSASSSVGVGDSGVSHGQSSGGRQIGARSDDTTTTTSCDDEDQTTNTVMGTKTPTITNSRSITNNSGANNNNSSGGTTTAKVERGITTPLNNWKGFSNQNRTRLSMVVDRDDTTTRQYDVSVCGSLGSSVVTEEFERDGSGGLLHHHQHPQQEQLRQHHQQHHHQQHEGGEVVENNDNMTSSSSLSSSEVSSRRQQQHHSSSSWRKGGEGGGFGRKESVHTFDTVKAVIVEVSERSNYDNSTDDDDDNNHHDAKGDYGDKEGVGGNNEEEEVESSSLSTSQSSSRILPTYSKHSTRTLIQGVAYYHHDYNNSSCSSDSYMSKSSSASSSFSSSNRRSKSSSSWRKGELLVGGGGRRESVRTYGSSQAVIVEVSERSNYSSSATDDEDVIAAVVDDEDDGDNGYGGGGGIEEEMGGSSSGCFYGGSMEEELESLTLSYLEDRNTQSSLVRKSDDNNRRRATYPRETEPPAPPPTTLDESFYSVDSNGFMTWKKVDHDRHRGVDDACCKEEEEESKQQPGLYDDPGGSRVESHVVGGGVEDPWGEDTASVEDDEEEKNDGGLLVDWDNSNNNDNESSDDFRPALIQLGPARFGSRLSRQMKIVSNRLSKSLTSLTAASSTKAAEEEEDSRKKFASSLPLPEETSDLLDEMANEDIIGDPWRRGLGASVISELDPIPNESNDHRRRDLIGTNRQESTRTFDSWAQSVNSADDKKGDKVDQQRRRGFGTNREESTRTFDSWAQSVNSADDMKEEDKKGGLLVDWDPTMTKKKINRLSLNELLTAEDGDDSKSEGVNDRKSTFPVEIKEIFDEGIQRRRSSAASGDFRPVFDEGIFDEGIQRRRSSVASGDFRPAQIRPAQIKLDAHATNNVGNRFSNRMKKVSDKLGSSLTSLTSNSSRSQVESWNLSRSLPSEQREQHLQLSPFNRRPLAASWPLAPSDHGLQQSNRSNTNDSVTFSCVPALSSSFSMEGEANNRPIRISREDNVDIVELRRELLTNAAAESAEMNRSRRKTVLGFR